VGRAHDVGADEGVAGAIRDHVDDDGVQTGSLGLRDLLAQHADVRVVEDEHVGLLAGDQVVDRPHHEVGVEVRIEHREARAHRGEGSLHGATPLVGQLVTGIGDGDEGDALAGERLVHQGADVERLDDSGTPERAPAADWTGALEVSAPVPVLHEVSVSDAAATAPRRPSSAISDRPDPMTTSYCLWAMKPSIASVTARQRRQEGLDRRRLARVARVGLRVLPGQVRAS
jgi:hypothetical protein